MQLKIIKMENIVVIGGGLMGTSAAWQLSQYGEKVVLLEQQNSNYKEGSSFGKSRIARSLGPKKDIFSFLHRTTVEETKKLLHFLNGLSPKAKHKMSDIYSTSPVTYIYNKSQEQELKQLRFKGQKDKFKKASGDKAFRKFGMTVDDSQVVVQEYRKYSGTLNPKALIKKMQLGIKKHGNTISFNRQVTRIVKKGHYYEIKVRNTKTGKSKIIQTRKVIVAAGPYTSSLLKKIAPYFKRLIIAKRLLLSFYKINKKTYQQLNKEQRKVLFKTHPVFDQQDEMYFAMLDKKDKQGVPIFKIGGHQLRGNIPNLDAVWRQKPLKKELKWSKKAFVNYLRMLEIPVRKKEIILTKRYYCIYSVSRTKIPYVTPVITKEKTIDKNMIVIGGMSGTGAKGCLAYGRLAADWLLNVNENSKIYQKTKKSLGVERLMNEVNKPFFKK